jgi:hypothetical protein
MRTLVAALLLACSAAHAGSFTVAMVNPKLSLVDLDTTDSTSPSITVAPGGNLADWSTPFSFGGEFWTDYNNVTPSPVIQLQGSLGAHSGLQWTGSLVIDTRLISTEERDEYFDLFGGAGGYIATGLISSFELLPMIRTGNNHEVHAGEFFLRNDRDEAADFWIDMSFSPMTSTGFARPVPEPSTYLMMVGGLALLPLARRKPKARCQPPKSES